METMILVMRHAEKPADAGDPHLAPEGAERAKRLATYIPQTFGEPDIIIAAAVSKHSARPLETVQPLALACNLAVRTPFADAQFEAQAEDILSNEDFKGKRIVVCWHHGEIPALLQALGATSGDYPNPWDPNVFNLIVQLRLTEPGQVQTAQVEEHF